MGKRLRGAQPQREWPPTPKADTLEGTRYYMHVFLASLKDCGHKPEHVREVMRELLAGKDGVEGRKP